MAVVAVKSTEISNRDATPAVINNARNTRGEVKAAIGLVALTNGDSIASVYRAFEVPSNARMEALRLASDAITTCAADVGIYRNTRDGGAVVDADFFASAQSLAAALTDTDILNESGVNTLAKQVQPLWQALGFTADPNTTFDVALTLTAAAASTGSTILRGRWAE